MKKKFGNGNRPFAFIGGLLAPPLGALLAFRCGGFFLGGAVGAAAPPPLLLVWSPAGAAPPASGRRGRPAGLALGLARVRPRLARRAAAASAGSPCSSLRGFRVCRPFARASLSVFAAARVAGPCLAARRWGASAGGSGVPPAPCGLAAAAPRARAWVGPALGQFSQMLPLVWGL